MGKVLFADIALAVASTCSQPLYVCSLSLALPSSLSLGTGLLTTPKPDRMVIRLWFHPPNPAVLPALTRYHYNVANTRVEQHVEKGNDDGLYISSVACCQELWALIMDAGTGFTAQVRLAPRSM